MEVVLCHQLSLEEKHIVDDLDAEVHRLVPDPELSAYLDQPLDQQFAHFRADLRDPEIGRNSYLAAHPSGKTLVIVDEVFNNEGKVGGDLGRTGRVFFWFDVSLSSNGFGAIGEVSSEVAGGG